MINSKYEIGDVVNIEVQSKEFGRIATQNAKNVILQKIREEERKVLYDQYYSMEKDVVTGVVERKTLTLVNGDSPSRLHGKLLWNPLQYGIRR